MPHQTTITAWPAIAAIARCVPAERAVSEGGSSRVINRAAIAAIAAIAARGWMGILKNCIPIDLTGRTVAAETCKVI